MTRPIQHRAGALALALVVAYVFISPAINLPWSVKGQRLLSVLPAFTLLLIYAQVPVPHLSPVPNDSFVLTSAILEMEVTRRC